MKFRFLDGLRGLAALIVVIDHFALSFFPAAVDGDVKVFHGAQEYLIEHTPLHLLVAGNYSVCIFFVLSGFVLSAKFFRSGDRAAVIASALKRYPRLTLPILGCVALAFTLMATGSFFNLDAAHITGSDWLQRYWRDDPNLLGALYHATIGIFVQGTSDYNTVLWTMKTELLGSFLVFGLLLALGRWRYRWAVYTILCLALFKSYYVAFIAGLALCDYYFSDRGWLRSTLRRGWWIPVAMISLFLGSSPVDTLQGTAFAGMHDLLPFEMSFARTTHIIGATGLLTAVLFSPYLQKILEMRPMVYLGRTSFALYLTHLLVIGSFSSWLFVQLSPHVEYRLNFLIILTTSSLIIWAVAHLFTKYVDEPAIRLSGLVPKLVRQMRRRIQVHPEPQRQYGSSARAYYSQRPNR